MHLLIDIGNSQAKVATATGDTLGKADAVPFDALPEKVLQLLSSLPDISCCAVSNVNRPCPELSKVLSEKGIPMFALKGDSPVGIGFANPNNAASLGSDRLAALIGARCLFPEGHLLVMDLGTCLTVDLLSDSNVFFGGIIAPGIALRFEAMARGTASLPLISAQGPIPAIGYDGPTAMRSGVVRGLSYELAGYVTYFHERYPSIKLAATGGGFPFCLTEEAENPYAPPAASQNNNPLREALQRTQTTYIYDESLVLRGLHQFLNDDAQFPLS